MCTQRGTFIWLYLRNTKIMVTCHEFFSLNCHAIMRHAFTPSQYLCRGVQALFLICSLTVTPLLLQSVRFEICFILCHPSQQFKVLSDFKKEIYWGFFSVSHYWKDIFTCSACSAEKINLTLNFQIIRNQFLSVSYFLWVRNAEHLYCTENTNWLSYSIFSVM